MMNKFLFELVKRWGAKQPWFFKVIMWLGIVTAVVIGLPDFLQDTGVWEQLPQAWKAIANQAVGWAAAVAALVAKLTVTSEDKKNREIED